MREITLVKYQRAHSPVFPRSSVDFHPLQISCERDFYAFDFKSCRCIVSAVVRWSLPFILFDF